MFCFFPSLVCRSQLYPPLTCFLRVCVIAYMVRAGKPNKAWHSTPSPGPMMSWCLKYPTLTVAPPSSQHMSEVGEPCTGVCVCVSACANQWHIFGGWEPPQVLKLFQTTLYRSWVWMGVMSLNNPLFELHFQVDPFQSMVHGRGVVIWLVRAPGLTFCCSSIKSRFPLLPSRPEISYFRSVF